MRLELHVFYNDIDDDFDDEDFSKSHEELVDGFTDLVRKLALLHDTRIFAHQEDDPKDVPIVLWEKSKRVLDEDGSEVNVTIH